MCLIDSSAGEGEQSCTPWYPAAAAAVNDLSLHVLVEFNRFLQTGQPPPQVGLVRHLALVLHDLVSGFCHYVLDLSRRARGKKKKRGDTLNAVEII